MTTDELAEVMTALVTTANKSVLAEFKKIVSSLEAKMNTINSSVNDIRQDIMRSKGR